MRDNPIPVLMLSSLTQEGAEVTLKALELGAVDFIDKTRAESTMDITLLANELISKVRTIAGVDMGKVTSTLAEGGPSQVRRVPLVGREQSKASWCDVVAIGASTGGPPALNGLIPRFPKGFPAGVIIVQHMPVGFTRMFAERLNTLSALSVTEAAEGDRVEAGRVLVAPAGKHLKLLREKNAYIVHLDPNPADLPHKPSVDVMMDSVARACGARGLGVLLTGMGSDGAQGMRAIKEAGGMTFAESEETCIVYGMPKCAVEEGVVDKVVPLYNMANEILKEI